MTDDDPRESVSAFIPEPASISVLELQQDIGDIAVLIGLAAFVGSEDLELGPSLYEAIADLEVEYVAYGSPFEIALAVAAQWGPFVSSALVAGGGIPVLLSRTGRFVRDVAEAEKLREEAATIRYEREKDIAIESLRVTADELANSNEALQLARLADEASQYAEGTRPEWVSSLIRLGSKNARIESVAWADRTERSHGDEDGPTIADLAE